MARPELVSMSLQKVRGLKTHVKIVRVHERKANLTGCMYSRSCELRWKITSFNVQWYYNKHLVAVATGS